MPVLVLGDGTIGQMMEPVEFDYEAPSVLPVRRDALRGAKGRPSRIVRSFSSNPADIEEINWSLFRRYKQIENDEVSFQTFMIEDAKLIVIAFGIGARIAKGAIKSARAMGMKVGMFRPITLWPFPRNEIKSLLNQTQYFLDFEMNMGQMVDDVKLALEGQGEVAFYGRPGGVLATPSEVLRVISRLYYQKGLN